MMTLEWEINVMLLNGEESVCYLSFFCIHELQLSIHEANMVIWASVNLTFQISAYELVCICMTLREKEISFDGLNTISFSYHVAPFS